jgi:hypothetical protein
MEIPYLDSPSLPANQHGPIPHPQILYFVTTLPSIKYNQGEKIWLAIKIKMKQ